MSSFQNRDIIPQKKIHYKVYDTSVLSKLQLTGMFNIWFPIRALDTFDADLFPPPVVDARPQPPLTTPLPKSALYRLSQFGSSDDNHLHLNSSNGRPCYESACCWLDLGSTRIYVLISLPLGSDTRKPSES